METWIVALLAMFSAGGAFVGTVTGTLLYYFMLDGRLQSAWGALHEVTASQPPPLVYSEPVITQSLPRRPEAVRDVRYNGDASSPRAQRPAVPHQPRRAHRPPTATVAPVRARSPLVAPVAVPHHQWVEPENFLTPDLLDADEEPSTVLHREDLRPSTFRGDAVPPNVVPMPQPDPWVAHTRVWSAHKR